MVREARPYASRDDPQAQPAFLSIPFTSLFWKSSGKHHRPPEKHGPFPTGGLRTGLRERRPRAWTEWPCCDITKPRANERRATPAERRTQLAHCVRDGSPPLTSGYIILGIISFQSQRPQRPGQADPIKSIPERENIPDKLAMIHFFFNLLLGHDDLQEWHVTIQVVHVFVVATQYQGS